MSSSIDNDDDGQQQSSQSSSSLSSQQQQQQQQQSSSSYSYDLGLGKNQPVVVPSSRSDDNIDDENNYYIDSSSKSNTVWNVTQNWMVAKPVKKPRTTLSQHVLSNKQSSENNNSKNSNNKRPYKISKSNFLTGPHPTIKSRRMVARDNASQQLRAALWDEQHYSAKQQQQQRSNSSMISSSINNDYTSDNTEYIYSNDNTNNKNMNNNIDMFLGTKAPPYPKAFYPDIDLSIPDSVYTDDGSIDLVWDLLRYEAYTNLQMEHEPLLVSFLHSTILNHDTLESSISFLLANRLQSPVMMISTQLQSLIYDAIQSSTIFRKSLRADIMAVRDRDPACNTLPDVFLYFKGFHALQSYRVANVLWNNGRHVLAQYLQSQVSQTFQIDIHPNATLGSGIMLDHGTGIVIGETARVGHNCSILHHVTLGGSGKKGVVRHPSIGNGVLLGAGATILGPVNIGDGSQVGAGTLVISDLPSHCVAVGVPARIIGSFVDVTEQPSIGMNQQIMDENDKFVTCTFESEGI